MRTIFVGQDPLGSAARYQQAGNSQNRMTFVHIAVNSYPPYPSFPHPTGNAFESRQFRAELESDARVQPSTRRQRFEMIWLLNTEPPPGAEPEFTAVVAV